MRVVKCAKSAGYNVPASSGGTTTLSQSSATNVPFTSKKTPTKRRRAAGGLTAKATVGTASRRRVSVGKVSPTSSTYTKNSSLYVPIPRYMKYCTNR